MRNLLQVLKICVAVGLVSWLVRTGKITLEPFQRLFSSPLLLFAVMVFSLITIFLGALRWHLLLKPQSTQLPFKRIISLAFMGLFFNYAIPGTVGGDVVKGYYLFKEIPESKLFAATSILMDRILGLIGLLILGVLAFFILWPEYHSSELFCSMGIALTALSLSSVLFMILCLAPRNILSSFTGPVQRLPGGKFAVKVYLSFRVYNHHQALLAKALSLSLLGHICSITMLFSVGEALGYQNITLAGFFFAFAVGSLVAAIPISPAGIGVGQSALLAIFTLLQGQATTLGPTVATISQGVQGIYSLVGAGIYFLYFGGNKTIQAGASQK